ncbi:MAG: S-layer homology domain-containing protein, partial [Clostridia bacterium]|nr:S-layer homology domain-containing protein [Clostridia bacterium]
MKTRNMITSLVLIAVLMLSAFSVFAGASFSDVKTSDWFYSYVSKAAEKGIVSGYPDGTFRPQNKVTYAEFLVMAMRGTKSSNTRGLNDWFAPYYYGAVDNGIINEGEIAYTSMNNPIPRGDMAVVMAGVLAFNNLDSVKTVN